MKKSGVGLAAAGYAALSLAYTWPLVVHLSSVVPHDRGDPLLVAWVLVRYAGWPAWALFVSFCC